MAGRIKHIINGKSVEGDGDELQVLAPFSGQPVASFRPASRQLVDEAISSASSVMDSSQIPPHRRADILNKTAELILQNKSEIALLICREVAKPIKLAEMEVDRTVTTLKLSAVEAMKLSTSGIAIEATPGFENSTAFEIFYPAGVVCCITPFNFPLNLVAHKIGPAFAAGCGIVLKPSSFAPSPAFLLVKYMHEAGAEPGWINYIAGTGTQTGQYLISNRTIAVFTFTGSREIGMEIKRKAYDRKVILELGANSATAVFPDADIEKAVKLCTAGGYFYAGQVCISLQRLFVHEKIYDDFKRKIVDEIKKIKIGNPEEPDVSIGPLIRMNEVKRIKSWIDEATDKGGRILTGGKVSRGHQQIFEPTLIEFPSHDSSIKIIGREAFAPVICIFKFSHLSELIEMVNDSEYGLQAGVLTGETKTAMAFARGVKTGGVVINNTCMVRADSMPYGGIKASGTGREGPAYAIREYLERKTILFHNL